MLKKLFKTILLKDIVDALAIGFKCCFTKTLTQKLKNIKRSEKFRKELIINKKKCIKCGICEGICPNKSVKLPPHSVPVFDFNKCCFCGLCQKACPKLAIEIHDENSDTKS